MPPWRAGVVHRSRTKEILASQSIGYCLPRRRFSTTSQAPKRDNEIAAKVFAHHVSTNQQASASQRKGGIISDAAPERDASQFTPSRPSFYRLHSSPRNQARGDASSQSTQSLSNRPGGKLLRLNRPPQRAPPQYRQGQRGPTKGGPGRGGASTGRNRRQSAGASIGENDKARIPEEKPKEYNIEPDEYLTAADIKAYEAMTPQQRQSVHEKDMRAIRRVDPNLYKLTKIADRADVLASKLEGSPSKQPLDDEDSDPTESDEMDADFAYLMGEDYPSREPVNYIPHHVTVKSLRADWPAFPSNSICFEEGIEEKLRWLARRFAHGHEPIDELAKRLLKGELVQFHSDKEKQEVLQYAREIQSEEAANAIMASEEMPEMEPLDFQPLAESDRTELIGSMVRGAYSLPAKQKSPVLDGIAKNLASNATYRGNETQKFMAKLESMLTSASPPRQTAKP